LVKITEARGLPAVNLSFLTAGATPPEWSDVDHAEAGWRPS
jgi:hypothetical protein